MASPFLAGDVVFVRGRTGFDATLINAMASLSRLRRRDGAAHFSHVGVMLGPKTMMETTETRTRDDRDLWHVYRANETRVFRWRHMDAARAASGYAAVQGQVGRMYPYWRLLVHALGLSESIHGRGMVCSELVAHYLLGAGYPLRTGWPDTDWLHDRLERDCATGEVEQVFFGRLVEHWPSGWDGEPDTVAG